MSLTVGSIVIRVTDLDAQLAFWTAALDYVPRQLIADDFALLGPRTGAGVGLSLDVVASPRCRASAVARSKSSNSSRPSRSTS